eukprot:TRINITY_DN12439_c0_g1_i2.p1 TRINITY_DN12439_c0_g1~~TRINITY_DN12439_c0_g1_i2.p1  ORF type:complete len:480 (-),score=68.45 TRINITY_DN12439_c0_g1_i2:105-1544(-)
MVERNDADWSWDLDQSDFPQDGGRGGQGTILSFCDLTGQSAGPGAPETAGWACVRWLATGEVNMYRVGCDNKFDLKFALGPPPGESLHGTGQLSIKHIRPTFNYPIGRVQPYTGLFDIRPEVCRRVGGFMHGDVVWDLSISKKATCIGVRPSCHKQQPSLHLWFRVDGAEGATIGNEDLTLYKFEGRAEVKEAGEGEDIKYEWRSFQPANDVLDSVCKMLKPTFGYRCGSNIAHYQKLDIRDEVIGKFMPGAKSGNMYQVKGDEDSSCLTLIGVNIPDGRNLPRLWFHEEGDAGAAILRTNQSLLLVGTRSIEEANQHDLDFNRHETCPQKLHQLACDLQPTLEFPRGLGMRTAMSKFDVRPDVVKQVSGGFESGQVLNILGKQLVVIGVRKDDRGLASVWFWQEEDPGAGMLDRTQYRKIMKHAAVSEKLEDLEALRSALKKKSGSRSKELDKDSIDELPKLIRSWLEAQNKKEQKTK